VRPDQRQVQPVIVDIVDDHQMYLGQWRKRLAYYKRCAYQNETWSMGATKGGMMKGAPAAAPNDTPPSSGCMIEDD
jgi:hypothetical protein